MGYAIHDLEITDPLPPVSTDATQSGVALVVRRGGRPIGFLMHRLGPGQTMPGDDLAQLLAALLGEKIVAEGLREELSARAAADPALRARVPMTPPSVTAAVCTKDRPALVARCLAALVKQRDAAAAAGTTLEILIVDNAPSDDRTAALVASHEGVRYAREPRPGLDFARNRALAEATGELLAFIDDDAVPDQWWLDGLLEAWRENPDAAAFTGLVLPLELETQAQVLFESRGGFRRGFEKIRHAGDTRVENAMYPAGAGNFGAGANMAFRRDVLLALGGFDEALDTGAPLPGGGDLDIFFRVVRAGHPLVYEPRYLAFHQHRRERRQLRRQYWTWGTGFMAFAEKSYGADAGARERVRGIIRWWLLHQVGQIPRAMLGRNPLPMDMIVAELLGGLVGLTGGYRRSLRRTRRIQARHP